MSRGRRPRPQKPNAPIKVPEVRPKAMLGDDDRPTEIHDPDGEHVLHTTRDQHIHGSTIAEMMERDTHQLSGALAELYRRATKDLPTARIDARAVLELEHEFEFDRRIGYALTLTLFDPAGRCVQIAARVDQDGNKVRRDSMISKLITI